MLVYKKNEELPSDFTTLFDAELFKFDISLLPAAITLYDNLKLKHEPLSLILPQFEVPLPALEPAVFHPLLRDLPPPPLELFDLDEQFASERVRLAQLTNKCMCLDLLFMILCDCFAWVGNNDDLEYYVRECAEILGVTEKLPSKDMTAKHILHHVFSQIVSWKKLNQE